MGERKVADDIIQVFTEGRIDAKSLSEFMYKPASFMVSRRLAPPINTINYFLQYFNGISSIYTQSSGFVTVNGVVRKTIGQIAIDATNATNAAIEASTVDGSLVTDALTTVTPLSNAIGAVSRNLKSVLSDYITVKFFGAKGDGVTDDSDAFQKYVNWAIANKSNYIYIPFNNSERYRLTRTIEIVSSGFMIAGNRAPSYTPQDGGYIFADDTVKELFNYGMGQSILTNQLMVEGIAFKGGGTAQNQSAIRMNANNNGPHRGIVFSKTCGTGFARILHVKSTTVGYIGAASVVFTNGCMFKGNDYVLDAESRVFGLLVDGIQSEQGARYRGMIDGGVGIKYTMLEGQRNVIDIDSNTASVVIEGNYMEATSGDFFARIRGSTGNCVFEERPNFISTIGSVDFYLVTGTCRINQMYEYQSRSDRASLYTLNDLFLPSNSNIMGDVYTGTVANSSDGFTGYCNPKPLREARSSAVTNHNLGSDLVKTPFGESNTGLISTGTSAYSKLDKVWEAGDILTVVVLFKVDESYSPTFNIYDNTFKLLGHVSQSTFQLSSLGRWQIAVFSKPIATAGTAVNIRFITGANNITVAATGVDVTPATEFKTFFGVGRGLVRIFNPMDNQLNPSRYKRNVPTTAKTIAAGASHNESFYMGGAAVGDIIVASPNGDILDLSYKIRINTTLNGLLTITNHTAAPISIPALTWKVELLK